VYRAGVVFQDCPKYRLGGILLRRANLRNYKQEDYVAMTKLLCATVAAATLLTVGCAKKVAVKAPPPAQPQPAQTSTPPPATVATRTEPAPTVASVSRPAMPDQATKNRIQELIDRLQDAYFDYNKHTLRADAEKSLLADAQALSDILKQYPDYKLTVEGYCDERGSEEYNLALGDKRARAAEEFLTSMGISSAQLTIVSFGKDRPVCTDKTEDCWQKNRRAHLTAAP
jgi:peptidoglycan-associated lipoprotein